MKADSPAVTPATVTVHSVSPTDLVLPPTQSVQIAITPEGGATV